jgi:hypothetical protein
MTLKSAVLRNWQYYYANPVLHKSNQILVVSLLLTVVGSGVLEYMENFQNLTENAAQPEPTNQFQASNWTSALSQHWKCPDQVKFIPSHGWPTGNIPFQSFTVFVLQYTPRPWHISICASFDPITTVHLWSSDEMWVVAVHLQALRNDRLGSYLIP